MTHQDPNITPVPEWLTNLAQQQQGNNTAPQQPNNAQPGGLLNRVAQNNQQNNPPNQNQNNPFRSRFAQNNNPAANQAANPAPAAAQNNQPAPPPLPPRPNNRFGANVHQLNWVMLPTQKTVVRFELGGLGDPFYKMLGHELNTDYGDARVVSRVLENGGDAVDELETVLDQSWQSYHLKGAMLVYSWKTATWKNILLPTPMPNEPNEADPNNANQQQVAQPQATQKPAFKVLRAIDLELSLNVLARARTQLLLAESPLVFSQQYLNRALVTDDPRMIKLVMATGYLEEQLV